MAFSLPHSQKRDSHRSIESNNEEMDDDLDVQVQDNNNQADTEETQVAKATDRENILRGKLFRNMREMLKRTEKLLHRFFEVFVYIGKWGQRAHAYSSSRRK
jgi:hypothetical protein